MYVRTYLALETQTEQHKASLKLSEAKTKATEIKTSTYTLGKAPENLTPNQIERLEMIAKTNPKLFRGYTLKEHLRMALKMSSRDEAKANCPPSFEKQHIAEYLFLKSFPTKLGVMRNISSIP